jgi:hypothetical protein
MKERLVGGSQQGSQQYGEALHCQRRHYRWKISRNESGVPFIDHIKAIIFQDDRS